MGALNPKKKPPACRLRRVFVLLVFSCAMLTLLARAIYLQHYEQDMLRHEGEVRHVRTVEIPVHRGVITDRSGNPLAVSTPVYSPWVDPAKFDPVHIAQIAEVLGISVARIQSRLEQSPGRRFVYLKRHVIPDVAERLRRLNITGLDLQLEYRRYYPTGEVSAHIVGMTDIDDRGIAGVEKTWEEVLYGRPGRQQVMHDRYSRAVRHVALIEPPRYGKDLALSLDQRIQYRAYRALKRAAMEHGATAGSVVVLNAVTGEILAAVNHPSFNPNDRNRNLPGARRNRAATDMFEPGSTIKPLVIAALLDGGHATPDTVIDTSPGYHHVGGKDIRDIRNYGRLDLAGIVVRSSNVGVSKAVMKLSKQELWQVLDQLGFGQAPGTGFPGETEGRLRYHTEWHGIDQAVMSYGYGVSVSPLQLAHAYTVFANDGLQPTLSLLRGNPHLEKRRVFSARTARIVRDMLERVVSSPEGTGRRARIKGYTAAGKTGTVHKGAPANYENSREYLSLFVGFAPVSAPRLVVAVIIDTPTAGKYHGGDVAAPVFARVMSESLWLLNVPGDERPHDGGSDVQPAGRL